MPPMNCHRSDTLSVMTMVQSQLSHEKESKYTDIAVRSVNIDTPHRDSHAIWDHPAELTFPHLPQPKLVLDLATPKGYKAELIRHCSKGAQPVPKTAYHSGTGDKHNCRGEI